MMLFLFFLSCVVVLVVFLLLSMVWYLQHLAEHAVELGLGNGQLGQGGVLVLLAQCQVQVTDLGGSR